MSDQDSENPTPVVEPMLPPENNGDWFLMTLIEMANGPHAISMGITLNSGGMLISGTLIGGKEYFKLFGEIFSSPFKEYESGPAIKESYAEYGKLYDNENISKSPLGYIHMKNVKFFDPSGRWIPNDGTLWRGRISQIAGFSLGSLGPAAR